MENMAREYNKSKPRQKLLKKKLKPNLMSIQVL